MSTEDRGRILIVDDELGMREMLSILFKREGYTTESESNGKSGIERIASTDPFDLVITDMVMPGADGMAVLEAAKRRCADTQVIVITAFGTVQGAVEAMQAGAYDYALKPFKTKEIKLLVERALEKRHLLRENQELRRQVAGRFEVENLVGVSQQMRQIVDLCHRFSTLKTTVLITGESGTGKELVARALHSLGPRSSESFVSINCGALPESLMESELFGHERGAFTGAVKASEGLFREAEGGTLFLDEIGEIPQHVQVKLLRAIQERSVRPVGGTAEVDVDVRIVAASNRDLDAEVSKGRFRSDLYYRLNVVRIDIPPLRERKEDIPVLVEYFMSRYSNDSRHQVREFDSDARRALMDHSFPGNVRELENIVERAVALASDAVAGVETLPPDLLRGQLEDLGCFDIPEKGFKLDETLARVEQEYIEQAIKRAEGIQTRAAELLGISFRSLRYRIQKLRKESGALASSNPRGEGEGEPPEC